MIRAIKVWPSGHLENMKVDISTTDITTDLFDTLRAARGIGLAANQIGAPHKVFVLHIPGDEPYIYWEPSFVPWDGDLPNLPGKAMLIPGTEGCLSFPNIYLENIPRWNKIMASWGTLGTLEGYQAKIMEGLEARAFQHECEHLDGETFLKHIPIERQLYVGRKTRKWKLKGWVYPTGVGTTVREI